MAKNNSNQNQAPLTGIDLTNNLLTQLLAATAKNNTKQVDNFKMDVAFGKMSEEIKNLLDSTTDDEKSNIGKAIQGKMKAATRAGATPSQIVDKMIESAEKQLKDIGKTMTSDELVKLFGDAGIGNEKLEMMKSYFQQTKTEFLGIKSIAEQISDELMTPFDYITGWVKKVPGGGLLYKLFGFDKIKKELNEKITKSLINVGKDGAKPGFDDLVNIAKGAFQSIAQGIIAIVTNPVLLGLTLLLGALYLIKSQFSKMTGSAASLRDETSLTAKEAMRLTFINDTIARQYGSFGVNMEVLAKSTAALVNEFKTSSALTEGMQKNAGLMVGVLGVAPDVAAKTLRVFQNMGASTDQMSTNLIGFVANASKMAGVSSPEVFKDIADSSEEIYKYFKGNLVLAAKSAIELRRMGSSIKEAANTAKNLLDFESSITAELEASVMAGQHLDFSRARYAAFTGDLVGSQKEILDQVEKINNFENLNILQKEAIAKAAGMELTQLSNMLTQRKAISKLTAQQKADYQKSLKALEDFRKGNAENLILENNKALATERFAQIWENLLYKLAQLALPLFEWIYTALEWIVTVLDNISKMFEGLGSSTLKWIAGLTVLQIAITLIVGVVFLLGKVFSKLIGVVFESIAKGMGALGEGIKKFGEGLKAVSWKDVFLGLVALAALAGVMWLLGLALQEFAKVDFMAALAGLGFLAALIGSIILLGIFIMGGGWTLLLAAGVALLVLAGIMYLLGKALQELATGADASDVVVAMLKKFSSLDFTKLLAVAAAIAALAVAVGALAIASALLDVGNAVVSFIFGKDDTASNAKDIEDASVKLESDKYNQNTNINVNNDALVKKLDDFLVKFIAAVESIEIKANGRVIAEVVANNTVTVGA